MKKSEFEKKVTKMLNEEETFLLSLVLLAHLHTDKNYTKLSDLIFLFDNYKGFKQFIKYYSGQTIEVPTMIELKQCLKLLNLFQDVYIDSKDFDTSYNNLGLQDLGLERDYCYSELSKFYSFLKNDNTITLNKLKKITKKYNSN